MFIQNVMENWGIDNGCECDFRYCRLWVFSQSANWL